MVEPAGGRTALITGGNGGLGGVVVAAFVSAGWRVVAPVRGAHRTGGGAADALGDAVANAAAAAVANANLPSAETVEADLTDADAVRAAVDAAAGRPDAPLRAVVNLVGGYAGSGLVHETPVADFERMLAVNLRPTYLVTRAALPHLTAAGGGSIVCVSSRAAVSPFAGAAGYVTAKAAVLAFANAVAVEYRSAGVRCNTVLPSVIDTPANRSAQPDADYSKWVTPADLAALILFLAGDGSRPTSGAAIPAYGRA